MIPNAAIDSYSEIGSNSLTFCEILFPILDNGLDVISAYIGSFLGWFYG